METTDQTGSITLQLYHGPEDSALFLKDSSGIIGRIYYTRRIHKYESRSDYDRLKTELETYGYTHGLLPEWERLEGAEAMTAHNAPKGILRKPMRDQLRQSDKFKRKNTRKKYKKTIA